MTDKIYTDEKIIHDLNCYENLGYRSCGYAIDLINRQKAEIERLTHKCDDCAGCTKWNRDCSLIRAEAIEEFAERLRASCDAPHWCVWLSEIDQIKEELTEGRQ